MIASDWAIPLSAGLKEINPRLKKKAHKRKRKKSYLYCNWGYLP